jgi:hypothetical protein
MQKLQAEPASLQALHGASCPKRLSSHELLLALKLLYQLP